MFTPNEQPVDVLHAGQVGYVMSTMKDPGEAPIGDTVFKSENADEIEPFEGDARIDLAGTTLIQDTLKIGQKYSCVPRARERVSERSGARQ